ncbi:MAG: TatD family hydrolase [Candidatus Staskawiczbacteria bacterium]|nr:TatD family hydrolase [Candidatus Staskawiczbacteria bacterium]
MLIDTHSHISFKAYDKDREEVIKRTRDEGVVCIDVGTKYETSKNAVELAEKNDNIYAAIGMHPIHIKTDLMKLRMDEEEGAFAPLGEEYDREKYKNLVLADRSESGKNKIVAIGEIGLDYYYKPKTTARLEQFKELQKKVFIEQLDLASELDLPVIVHCRMAFDDLYEILKNRKNRGVIHCFTGTLEEAEKFIALGFYLGINGIIFKLDLDEVIKKTPLDKILIETDCPYLTPPLARRSPEGEGGRNEPIFVKYVAERIAELKGITFDEVASATTQNAKNLFKI